MSIIGEDNDTLVSVGKLSVTISPKELLKGKILIHRIAIEDGMFSLITYNKATRWNNVKRILNIQKDTTKVKKPLRLPDIQASSIVLKNIRFKLLNATRAFPYRDPRCFNTRDMDIKNINARIHRARYSNGTLTCRIRDLSGRDKCGYELKSLSGFFIMDASETSIQNLNLIDSYSKITANYLSFGYESGKDLRKFTQKIVLGADFKHALLDFRSIGMFAPALLENDLKLDITGEVKGPVIDLQSDNLKISYADSTYMDFGIHITGLPKIKNTIFDAALNEVTTTGAELSEIVSKFSKSKKKNNIGNILPSKKLSIKGYYSGSLYDADSEGTISIGRSSVVYDAAMLKHSKDKGLDINANLSIKDLNAEDFTKTDLIGNMSLDTDINLNLKKKSKGGLSFDINSLKIQEIDINDYNYRNIHLLGGLHNGNLDIRLLSKDESFSAILQAVVQFSDGFKPNKITTFLDIPHADLKAINIIKEGEKATASIQVKADVKILEDKSLLGSILLDNIHYANDFGHFVLDSLHLRSILSENNHIITLRSPILTANYKSTDNINRLINRLQQNILHKSFPDAFRYHADTISGNPDIQKDNGYYQFKLTTHNTSQICDIIMPGLHIAANTSLDINLNEHNTFDFNLISQNIAIGKNRFKDINISLDNKDSILKADLDIHSINIGKISLDSARIYAIQQNSDISVDVGFNNSDTTNLNLSSIINLKRTQDGKLNTYITFKESGLKLKGRQWYFSPATISISPKFYSINNFQLFSDEESIVVEGEISEEKDNLLKLDLNNFDLSLINDFSNRDLGVYGRISGNVELSNIFTSMGVTLSLDGTNMKVFDREFGTLSAMSRWDQNRKRFNILLNNKLNSSTPINAVGYFIPERSYINLNLALSSLQTYYLTPILENAVKITDGTISGDINIAGPFNKLIFTGNNIALDSVLFIPNFTQVPYYISGPIELSERNIDLKQMEIYDPYGSKAILNGSISHNFLKNFYLDLGLNFNNLLAINTSEYDNNTLYGKAYASGNVNLTGALNDLTIDVQVKTGDNSAIHIPMKSSTSASTTDLISYSNFSDTTDVINIGKEIDKEIVKKPKSKSNINIKGHAEITQTTELLIELNKQLGEILRCRGNGNVDLNISPAKKLIDLRGEYNITGGNYHFVAMTIVSRDFIINNGGSITFNGDIKNTNLNVGATYQTKASISTLIADTTSVGNRKTINCGINLAGSLTNPEISFAIDIPDLDPITKGMVESALSTPDKIQRQFMSLLISGSFVPDQQSGIVNNSSLLYSNASEILSNQFNNIFRQLDIPLDLGLNYQHEETSGKDMFDVAVSYQAFNNRLIINGNVGNSETSSNWAGDFDAEIKVDKQGKLRISLFTRAADSYSNYLDNTQRSGFGISYQDEFDTFKEFIRNLFYTKRKKEEYEIEQIKRTEQELLQEAEAANIKKETVLRPKEDILGASNEGEVAEYTHSATEYIFVE